MPDISIIYEDDNVLVIDKPSGVQVHADGKTHGATVVDWLLRERPGVEGVGEPQTLQDGTVLTRPGIVHRLDRDTSGVMIIAKTSAAFVHIKEQFHDRRVQKEYRAFVYGSMKEPKGTITRKIGRSANDPRKRSAEKGAKGVLRDASTDWEVLVQNATYAYLKLTPHTGRTHQLRVHLKGIGRPIVRDELYAPAHMLAQDTLGIDRLALHAHTLTLKLLGGNVETFTAQLPESFKAAAGRIAEQGDV